MKKKKKFMHTGKTKVQKQSSTIRIKDWFYMNQKEITVHEIKECMQTVEGVQVEIWREAGIVEITLSDGHSIDMEEGQVYFADAYSDAFVEKHQVHSLFYVTIAPDFFAVAEPVMKAMTATLGGFFCADTDDFQPIVK